ncbi:MAG: efflux RND transporter permease subunit [Desulfobacula sp.]|jgi:CzcA family heavy metal efflux pump|nr:efflux RND transporter permease subunit [Desulfobacula sp.]
MKKLIAVVLKNRTAITFIVFILTLLGGYSLITLTQSVFPKVVFPQIVIRVDRGFAPLKDMEMFVTKPLEDGLHSISGIKFITSETFQGSAELKLTFNWGTDLRQAYQSVLSKTGEIKAVLPPDTRLKITQMTTSAFPVAGFSLYSDTVSLLSLRKYTLRDIKPILEKVAGVDKVEVIGGVGPEYKIVLKPEKLVQYHLDPLKIIETIKKSNTIDFLGTITEEYKLFLGVSDFQLKGTSDIETIIVGQVSGNPVYLKQVAQVNEGTTALAISTSTDGHPAVLFNITKHPNANVIKVSQAVAVALANIQTKLPSDMHISKWYDLSEFVRKSIRGVVFNLLTGIVIISLVVFLLLRRFRTSLPMVIFMPLTLVITLLVMKILGLTLNIMTLGGLTAAVGILVDNASVVVENISRYYDKGVDTQTSIIDGTAEVIPPLFSATLTTIAVFIPMIMLSGVSGFFFKASSTTIAISLTLSLILAIFFIPIMVFHFFGQNSRPVQKVLKEGLLQRIYKIILGATLKRSGIIVLLSTFMAGAAVVMFTTLPTSFLPLWDEGTFIMDLDTVPGTNLDEMSCIVNGVEKVIRTIPEIKTYSRQTGDEAVRPNEAHFYMHPQPVKGQASISVFDVMDKLETELTRVYPELNVDLHQILPDRFIDLSGRQNAVIVKLTGNSQKDLSTAFSTIKTTLEKIPSIQEVKGVLPDTSPGFRVEFHKEKLIRAGLTEENVSAQIKTALAGTIATSVSEGVRKIDVRVIYPVMYKKYLEQLPSLPIFTATGKYLPLSSVADVKVKNMPRITYHENGIPIINIDIKTKTGNLRKNVRTIQNTLDTLALPSGVNVNIGGDWNTQQKSFQQLIFILCLSGFLVFSLLLLEFKGYKVALVIFIGTIFSQSFVVFGLALTHTSFNVSTFIGLVTSLGIVVNNGILVIDFVERYKNRGISIRETLIKAGVVRIRPILITSITTNGGFLPMALRFGNGGEMLQPFAVAVIFGLIGSLFFSLIVTPCMYLFFIGENAAKKQLPHDL